MNIDLYQHYPPTATITAKPEMVIMAPLWSGTGSTYDVDRVAQWKLQLQSRVAFIIDVETHPQADAIRLDVRTARKHIDNIRETLNPAISDLASICEVSRQAVYKWISGDSRPEEDKFAKLRALSQIADKFKAANITRAASLIKLKTFNGESLIDLIKSGKNQDEHIETLISEAIAMAASYKNSGLSTSKANKTSDWQSSISIPGSFESS